MEKRWFKAKTYGYGWVPCTWEGWTVVGGYIVLSLAPTAIFLVLGLDTEHSGSLYAAFFLPYIALLTGVLLWISLKKGGKPQWRWGK